MSLPTRIQLFRQRGHRIPAGTVKCDRSGPLGNPFRPEREMTAVKCIRLFRLWAEAALEFPDVENGVLAPEQKTFRRAFLALEANPPEHLGCWCALSSKCHVDQIIELLKLRAEDRHAIGESEKAGTAGGAAGTAPSQ